MFGDGNAAPVVGDRQAIAFLQRNLDPRRVACDRFVHRVVENFGSKVMQRAIVSSADIHPRAAAHRLQPF